MKKIIFLIALLFWTEVLALEDTQYKRYLAPSLFLVQNQEETALVYKNRTIKTYKNVEFNKNEYVDRATGKLLCDITGPQETPSIRAEQNIGKEYLRSCLIRRVQSLGSRYLLFTGPDSVSLYDKELDRFFHQISSIPLKIRISQTQWIVFLSSYPSTYCDRSVIHYLEWKIKTLLTDCSYENQYGHIRIDSFVAKKDTVTISYQVYELVGDEYVLSPKKYSVSIKLS